MRVPVYMVCAAIIVAVKGEDNYYTRTMAEEDPALRNIPEDSSNVPEDPDRTLGYILPKLMYAQREADRQWGDYFSLPDLNFQSVYSQTDVNADTRSKRGGASLREATPSLSISNSLDVLRNRLLLEISRKKEMEGAFRNRNLLCKIGKRGAAHFDFKRRCDGSNKFIEDKLGEPKADMFLVN